MRAFNLPQHPNSVSDTGIRVVNSVSDTEIGQCPTPNGT